MKAITKNRLRKIAETWFYKEVDIVLSEYSRCFPSTTISLDGLYRLLTPVHIAAKFKRETVIRLGKNKVREFNEKIKNKAA